MSLQNSCEVGLGERPDGPTQVSSPTNSKQDFSPLLSDDEAGGEVSIGENSNLLKSKLDHQKGMASSDNNCKPAQVTITSSKGRNAIGDVSKDNSSSRESSTSTINLEDEEHVLLSGNPKNEAVQDTDGEETTEDSRECASISPILETGSEENLIPTNREISDTSSNKRNCVVDKTLDSEDLSGLSEDHENQTLCSSEVIASPTSDVTDHELLQADRNRTSIDMKSGKDSAYSESPCSEFSAASSIASCAEDSGISSTVRDDELEEIPLADSNGFNPELFHEMSRLTTDDFVSSWVPKSMNTYAPNIVSKGSLGQDDNDGRPKQTGFKALFSRSGGENSQNTVGWKLFGKIPPKEASQSNENHAGSSFKRDDVKRRSFGDSTTPTTKPKFLSLKRNSAAIPSSTTALIFENRPSNLPAKSPTEEKKHKKMYEAMVAEAKKKELRDKKKQDKEMKQKSKQEKGIASAACVWTNEILPNWESMKNSRKAKDLWWQGLPPSVRGKIWRLAIGNDLQITYELFDIFQSHAYEKLIVTRNHRKKNKEIGSVAQLPTNDSPVPVVSSEHKVELIMLDVSRTFPSLCIFQEGGPFHDVLHSILGAYTCYRPDVGYVQGMSFIAAVLLLNMDPPDAFVCFANLLNKPCQLAFFRVDHPLMKAYFATFEILLHEFLNKIFVHFTEESFSPDMYLIDWIFTLFSKSLPLDVACRVWDVFCRDGDDYLFRTALGILKFYQDDLLEMDFIHLGQFLTKLPDDISANSLFDCISSVNLTKQKFNQTLATQKELATQIKTVTASAAK